ncbi:uncharacterized protein LOC135091216 [Scylla paramamosain]|uniref:uncharacterized protein LOC135091216 n=1 Tax=Scylla paramamosain TaxID=85552 RepID=UPI00308326FD
MPRPFNPSAPQVSLASASPPLPQPHVPAALHSKSRVPDPCLSALRPSPITPTILQPHDTSFSSQEPLQGHNYTYEQSYILKASSSSPSSTVPCLNPKASRLSCTTPPAASWSSTSLSSFISSTADPMCRSPGSPQPADADDLAGYSLTRQVRHDRYQTKCVLSQDIKVNVVKYWLPHSCDPRIPAPAATPDRDEWRRGGRTFSLVVDSKILKIHNHNQLLMHHKLVQDWRLDWRLIALISDNMLTFSCRCQQVLGMLMQSTTHIPQVSHYLHTI